MLNNRLLDELDVTERVEDMIIQCEEDFTKQACELYLDLVSAQLLGKSIENYAMLRYRLKNAKLDK